MTPASQIKQLRPYQEEATRACFDAWRDGAKNIVAVLATGTGKTFFAARMIEQVVEKSGKKVLWLAHRSELIEQAERTIRDLGLGTAVEMADETTGNALFDFQVAIASVQTLSQDKRLARFDPSEYALVVMDECHHGVSVTYRKILTHFADCKVLGLTATPYRTDKVGLNNVFEKVAFEYPILQGISEGYLCPIISHQVQVQDLHLESVKIKKGEFDEKEITELLMAEKNLRGMVQPTLDIAGSRPTIVFCTNVAHAEAITACFNRVAEKPVAVIVHGALNAQDRAMAFRRFETGQCQYLVNVGVATEGYDHPPTACVALFRPLKSLGLLCQMIGRGTRIAPGKGNALVLDFVGAAGSVRTLNAIDVLDGTLVDDTTKKKAQKYAEEGDDIVSALQKAKQDIAKMRQVDAKIHTGYKTTAFNLFNIFAIPDCKGLYGGEPLTGKQRDMLIRAGVEIERGLEKGEASRLIAEIVRRREGNLATLKQAKHLARNGFADAWEVSFKEASERLNKLWNK